MSTLTLNKVSFSKWICKVDMIFTATDGKNYFIDTNKDEISEYNYGYTGGDIDFLDEIRIGFVNDNFDRWELDVE